jgi:hypothetical protein
MGLGSDDITVKGHNFNTLKNSIISSYRFI